MYKQIKHGLIVPAVAGLIALGASAQVLAEGCMSDLADTAIFAKGKQFCENIANHVGCDPIAKGTGTCIIVDPNNPDEVLVEATSTIADDGSVSIAVTKGFITAWGLNGITQGNACLFLNDAGVEGNVNNIGFAVSDNPLEYTNIQEVIMCTDLTATGPSDIEPDLEPCSTSGIDESLDTCKTSKPGATVDIWTPTYASDGSGKVTGSELRSCVCDYDADGNSVPINVYPCELDGDDGNNSTINCFVPSKGDVEVTTIVEYFTDAKRCSTSGGTRTCDCIDNPFTACNECTDSTCTP